MLLKRVLITLLMCLTFSSTIYASEYVDVVGDKLVAEELYNAFMSSNGSCDAYSYNKHVDVGRLKTNYRLDILRLYLDLNYFPSSYFALGFHDNIDGSQNVFITPLNGDYKRLYQDTLDYESKVKEIVDSSINYNMSDREKVIYFNYRLINSCEYDNDEDNDGFRNFTAYNALIDGLSVCDGYAQAFYTLCTEAGIPCRYIIGSASDTMYPNHAWNAVFIDDEWLYVDSTWNDTEDKSNRNKYLLITKEEMERTNHIEFYYFENDISFDEINK